MTDKTLKQLKEDIAFQEAIIRNELKKSKELEEKAKLEKKLADLKEKNNPSFFSEFKGTFKAILKDVKESIK